MRPLLLCLFLASTALAEVRDPTNLFSPRAQEEANRIISDMRRATGGREFTVEVIPEVPANVRGRTNEPGFWNKLTENRAADTGTQGIYALITREPRHLHVSLGDKSDNFFTTADRDRLIRVMGDNFKNGDFDRGLIDGTKLVDQTLRGNYAAAQQSSGNRGAAGAPAAGVPGGAPTRTNSKPGLFSGNFCLWIGIGLVAFLVISMFLKRRVAAQQGMGGYGPGGGYGQQGPQGGYGQPGYGQPGYGQPAAGGGFGRGMLGGLLGGLGGGWLYDKMRGHGGGSDAHASPPPAAGGGFTDPGPDTSFGNSAGTDWGDSGGGGPVESGGGGDSGGTDF